ncbi:MAG: SCO family protein [Planctomycetaceae bacterium]|nr:SCO family protein [Planctomycetaceae bacterium]
MSRSILGWLAVLFLVMGGTIVWMGLRYAGALAPAGSDSEPDLSYLNKPADASQEFLEHFTLTDQAGKPLASKQLAGEVYVTNFFFSSCPGTCLQQNQKIHEIARQYGPKGVRFLSITCDPEIDSPDRLREYATKLEADTKHWSFLTGDLIYTRRVAGEIYRIPLDKQTHSERFFVTDKWGNIRDNFAWNKLDQITQMRSLLDKLLEESAEPEELKAAKEELKATKEKPPAEAPAEASATEKPGASAAATEN